MGLFLSPVFALIQSSVIVAQTYEFLSFDIHYSIFEIRFFRVSFSIRLAAVQASGWTDPRTLCLPSVFSRRRIGSKF